jgi:hypothetical protein
MFQEAILSIGSGSTPSAFVDSSGPGVSLRPGALGGGLRATPPLALSLARTTPTSEVIAAVRRMPPGTALPALLRALAPATLAAVQEVAPDWGTAGGQDPVGAGER